ncbi:MAG: hypothetical protein J6A47_02470 [Bacilli bacterium]|nr:hypothetical protein [Bacilli bacterium]
MDEVEQTALIYKLINNKNFICGKDLGWLLALVYDIPFGITCLLSYEFLQLLCQAFLHINIDRKDYSMIPQRRYASVEGGYIAMDAALMLGKESFIDLEMYTGKRTAWQVIKKLEKYITMYTANRNRKNPMPKGKNYVLAFMSHPKTRLVDKDGKVVSILRYHHERVGDVDGETIPFEFVLVNIRAIHEDPLINEICHDLLLDDPELMHNKTIGKAYTAFITHEEVKKAMCLRDKHFKEEGLKEGEQRARDNYIRRSIALGTPAENICATFGIPREELKAKYRY